MRIFFETRPGDQIAPVVGIMNGLLVIALLTAIWVGFGLLWVL